jgi:uncharacterized protein
MKYGLTDSVIEKIHRVFSQFPAVDKVVLYGSRAKDNYKASSDIDLTLYGAELTHAIYLNIIEALDELLLPYMIDVSIFAELHNKNLEEHICRVGVIFYQRNNTNMVNGE